MDEIGCEYHHRLVNFITCHEYGYRTAGKFRGIKFLQMCEIENFASNILANLVLLP